MTQPPHRGALLGIDVGTSAVKAVLFTPDGDRLGSDRVALNVRCPRPGYSEVDAEEVWAAVVTATRGALTQAGSPAVQGIGVSAAAPTPLIVRADGEPLSPVCTFADARAASDLDALAKRIDVSALEALTGNRLALPTCSSVTALHLRAMAAEQADVRFGHLTSFIVHRLTGRWVMDATNASYTGAVAARAPLRWSEPAAKMVGVPLDLLPELASSEQPAGTLTRRAMEALGVDGPAVVAVGAADTASAALAVGCLEDGDAFESVGTSGVLTVCRAQPATARYAMNRAHILPGRWLSHAAMSSTGASVSWMCRQVLHGSGECLEPAALAELAGSSRPGAGGVVFLPYLAGERSPVWDSMARGAWIGMTLATTSADLARAVLEGSAYGLRQLIELEVATSGDPMPELLSVGGGANSAVWSTIKADITGRTLHRATDVDASVRGAAMLAAVACGARADPVAAVRACRPLQTHTVVPTADEVTRDTYDRFYGVYTDLYPALRPFFPRLHGIESDLRTNPEMAPRLAEIAPA